MQISLDGEARLERSVLALGMFDGVHRGHQVLLRRARSLAVEHGVPLVACTFVTHPMALIAPEKCPPMLTTLEERARLMERLGVDILCAQPFDQQMMNQEPGEYIAALCMQFHPMFIVAGYNFTFGRAGEGTPELLEELGEVFGFATQVVPKITLDAQEVSSTAIRGWLSRGEVAKVRELLGYPYTLQGSVTGAQGELALLTMEPREKQSLPQGLYRATLSSDKSALPATIRIHPDGRIEARLPKPLTPGESVALRFYHRNQHDAEPTLGGFQPSPR